ncbi:LacI family transcriptional regulator [Solitalea longa]|uniref:LacI family transcriptional regulator n=1 Tax=Solitalea longa TaxID=2079460 RepID=A0A2S5A235_9SPHI|nr:LacI family DNA-binding transcriptional regulator [Solitalea longa]POY36615.1 LacI family transcriptional regulator [Solitalea longa]
MKKPVTIKDLSKHLLLSTSTISRALTNDKNIRKETREKVLQAAQELGYKPNLTAVNLKLGRSNSVGVIVPEMITPFASQVLEGIQEILWPEGYRVIIAQSEEDPQTEKKNLQLMEQFQVDGIIICVCDQAVNQSLYLQIQQKGIPMVFYDRISKEMEGSQVIVDDYMKSVFMVEHLIQTGRKNIVHLHGPSYINNSAERFKGYKKALEKHKIPYSPELVIKTGLTFDDGMNAARQLLESNLPFDSIFAFTDTLAIGAMNYLREQNIKIPEQVAVASFSGTTLSTLVYPQLTTVEQPLKEMGRTAAEMILNKISDKSYEDKTVVLDAKIKIRASTTV